MRWPLYALGIVAATPFALLRCKSTSEPPPPITPIAAVTTTSDDAHVDASSVDASVAVVVAAVDAGIVHPMVTLANDIPVTPKYDPVACPKLQAALTKVWSDQACKSDGDCGIGYGYCSCGSPIAARALPKLEIANRDFSDHGCFLKNKIPCPSCPPPPPPKCVGGKCS